MIAVKYKDLYMKDFAYGIRSNRGKSGGISQNRNKIKRASTVRAIFAIFPKSPNLPKMPKICQNSPFSQNVQNCPFFQFSQNTGISPFPEYAHFQPVPIYSRFPHFPIFSNHPAFPKFDHIPHFPYFPFPPFSPFPSPRETIIFSFSTIFLYSRIFSIYEFCPYFPYSCFSI